MMNHWQLTPTVQFTYPTDRNIIYPTFYQFIYLIQDDQAAKDN